MTRLILAAALAAAAFAEARPEGPAGIEWVAIPAGSFLMGSDAGPLRERPRHHVIVRGFEMSRSPVTEAQYRRCVRAGACTPPGPRAGCGPFGDDYPVVCVDWSQARAFAKWAGARLPSEAEWEYAAGGAGEGRLYPWGNEEPNCAVAVYRAGARGDACGRKLFWPVCSRPRGDTPQGLCDMAGNVGSWVEDAYHPSYEGAPADGSAWEGGAAAERVSRGGAFFLPRDFLRVSSRVHGEPTDRVFVGIRLARAPRASLDGARDGR